MSLSDWEAEAGDLDWRDYDAEGTNHHWSICDPCKQANHLGCVMAGPNEECCCAE